MTRAEFKKTALKVVTLAQVATSFTPTPKDDQVVQLLDSLITDNDKFQQVCDIIGLPPDATM